MIIDTQVHLCGHGWVTRGYLRGRSAVPGGGGGGGGAETGISATYNKYHGTNYKAQEFHEKVMRPYVDILDATGDNMVKWMDEAGLDKCVIYGVDWAYGMTGEPRVTNKEQNKIHADAAKRHPDRLIALAAIDPRRPDAVAQFVEAVEDWSMKGLKLHPGAGFRVDDPVCYPMIDLCSEYGLPVYIHTGMQPTSCPTNVSRLASLYPQVKMVMGHAGMQWPERAIGAVMGHDNVSTGVELHQRDFVYEPQAFYKWLRRLIDLCTPWKILFSSDSPDGDAMLPEKDWVDVFRNPKTDIKFAREEMDIILGKAAQIVFDIKD
jgi:predicted TIM-barrel fold metal-dependent hydrolase